MVYPPCSPGKPCIRLAEIKKAMSVPGRVIISDMKNLLDVLIDYDLALLEAIASGRGLTPPPNQGRQVLAAFADDLLSPASIAIALAELSPTARAALQALVQHHGLHDATHFSLEFGTIRVMGSEKLRREQPWLNPESAAEQLWYLGLLGRGIRHTRNGPENVVFIPNDVMALLPDLDVDPAPPKKTDFPLAPEPGWVYHEPDLAGEALFALLVYVQTHQIRLPDETPQLPPEHQQALQATLPPWPFSPGPAASGELWLTWLSHLANRAEFWQGPNKRLRLNVNNVRPWLQSDGPTRRQRLQTLWRSDPTWNDLWHVPGLYPQAGKWDNSPLRGRARLLAFFSKLPQLTWLPIEGVIQTLKRLDPDFQRGPGDYQRWEIHNAAGESLTGFAHWDAVEGALVRHLLTHTLFALGVVALGAPAENTLPTTFRLIEPGFFDPALSTPEPPTRSTRLRINPGDFRVRVPHAASLYDRFQLARFAELQRREKKQTIYQITRQSYRRAQEQSIALEQILAFLKRATQHQVPLALSDALQTWDQQLGAVKIERLTVLRVNRPELVEELLNHPRIGPLLNRPLGKQSVLVPEENVDALQQALIDTGYLNDEGQTG